MAKKIGLGLVGIVLALGVVCLVGVSVARPSGGSANSNSGNNANNASVVEMARHHMATKSSYWSDPSLGLPTDPVDQPPAQCKAVFVNLLARHGTRYPTSSDINKLNSLQSKLQQYGSLLLPQFSWLKNWTNPFRLSLPSLLPPQTVVVFV